MKIMPNTPVSFYKRVEEYVSGSGVAATWQKITTDEYETYFVEWVGAFGDRAFTAATSGNKSTATIRMYYNPTIYEALRTSMVTIIKGADASAIVGGVPSKDNPNVYEIWGEPDNAKQENRFMEFLVRRYEGV